MMVWILLHGCTTPVVPLGTDTARQTVDTDTVDTGNEDTASPDTTPHTDAPLELCINEWMPANAAALHDEKGNTPDWLELHNPGNETVDASGWSLTDDPDDPTQSVLPPGTELAPGAFLLLLADGVDAPGHVNFRLSSQGGSIGLFAPDGRGQVIHHGVVQEDFSLARYPDCCTGTDCLVTDYRGTPGYSNVPLVWVEETLLDAGSTWAYWDQGTEPAGGDWMAPDHDDSTWPMGAAPLGFGDHHQQTTINGGPANARHTTTWARIHFTVDAIPEDSTAWIELMLDDGAVVWLNGQEALRSNMPEGSITASTLASTAIGAPNESLMVRHDLDVSLLQEGDNVLAIEVHQASANSSDLTLDAALGLTSPEAKQQ